MSASPRQKKKKKKEKKVKKTTKGISTNFTKFEQGQTEQELAELRESMRTLKKNIDADHHLLVDNDEETALHANPDAMTKFDEYKLQHANHFKQVNRNRELAQNVEIHNTLGEIVLEQATKANNFAKLSTQTLISSIHEKFPMGEDGEIDWVAMGRAAAALFNAPPRTAFLHGAMMKNVVVKARKTTKRKRVGRDTKSLADKAGILDNLKESDDKDDSVNLMASVESTCRAINENKKAKTDFLELIVDPTSFPRTVRENFFDFIFFFTFFFVFVFFVEVSTLPTLRN